MDAAPTYLVVIDDSPECRVAMRFAVLRAAHVGARVRLVNIVPPPEFMQWGAIESAIAQESEAEAGMLLADLADAAEAEAGARPETLVLTGEAATVLLDHVRGDPQVRALVLGAASRGASGPLLAFFTGERAGQLPCAVIVVPGGLEEDRLASIT